MDGENRLIAKVDGHTSVDREWPADETRIPDWIYTDPDVYEREIEKIFTRPPLELRRARMRSTETRQLHTVLSARIQW